MGIRDVMKRDVRSEADRLAAEIAALDRRLADLRQEHARAEEAAVSAAGDEAEYAAAAEQVRGVAGELSAVQERVLRARTAYRRAAEEGLRGLESVLAIQGEQVSEAVARRRREYVVGADYERSRCDGLLAALRRPLDAALLAAERMKHAGGLVAAALRHAGEPAALPAARRYVALCGDLVGSLLDDEFGTLHARNAAAEAKLAVARRHQPEDVADAKAVVDELDSAIMRIVEDRRRLSRELATIEREIERLGGPVSAAG